MRWLYGGMVIAVLAVLAGVIVSLAAPTHEARTYPQSTPDETIASLWAMLEAREADRVGDLFYAESDEMRAAWDALSGLLGRCQELAGAIAEKFPAEVEEIRRDPSPLFDLAQGLTRGQGARRNARESRGDDDLSPRDRRVRDTEGLARVLADPFGWASRVKDRVSTAFVSDDTAAITVDGKPALGVGIMIREQEGRWWIVAPLNLPMASKWAPRNAEEWSIVASLLVVLDNAIAELTADVRGGKAETLDDCARLAGEKAVGPAIICLYAYNRAIEARAE